MRKFLPALGVSILLSASTALAAPTCTSFAGLPATDCTAGPFTFSNFSATSFNVSNVSLWIGGITSDANSVTLQLNPMLGVTGQEQDVWLQYAVSSTQPVTGIATANGGNPAMGAVGASSIATWVCAGGNAGPGGCGSSASSALAYVQANGGETVSASLSGSGSTFSTFQNIHVPAGGTVGNFTQTFSFGNESVGAAGQGSSGTGSSSAVSAGAGSDGAAGGTIVAGMAGGDNPSNSAAPEPMSLVLIGSGLLGLGVLRRKRA